MVRITDTNGTFCIDKTEVTNRHLNAFIASSSRPTPPSTCSFKTTYGGTARSDDDMPATLVDWCDAWMYCKWAGKRLCGSRNGTAIIDETKANDAKISEWFAACSHSGAQQYPYSGSFATTACNGCQRTSSCNDGGSPLLPVGTLATCEGGYAGIFDMSGNVAEWEDNCDTSDTCPPRGGTAAVGGADLTCAIGNLPNIDKRNQKADRVGIRCCAD
jgi:formylglycine-generating enzyme required for sulfatase activity